MTEITSQTVLTFDESLLKFTPNLLSESQQIALINYSLSKGFWKDQECVHYIGSNKNNQCAFRLIEILSTWEKPNLGGTPFWYLNKIRKANVSSRYLNWSVLQKYNEEIAYLYTSYSVKDQISFQTEYEYLYQSIEHRCNEIATDSRAWWEGEINRIHEEFKFHGDDDEKTPAINTPSQIPHNNTPAYLDEQHPNFAPELKVAIEAWEHIYSNPNKKVTRGSKPSVTDFLHNVKKQKSKLKNAYIERIASVITPKIRKETKGVIST